MSKWRRGLKVCLVFSLLVVVFNDGFLSRLRMNIFFWFDEYLLLSFLEAYFPSLPLSFLEAYFPFFPPPVSLPSILFPFLFRRTSVLDSWILSSSSRSC